MESTLIKGRDFIFFGLQPWDIPIGSNCKNIAVEVSKFNRVLYVNRPLDRISAFTNRKNTQTRNRLQSVRDGRNTLLKVKDNLWVLNPRVIMESINFLPHNNLYHFLSKRNTRKLAAQILKMSAELNLKDPILFIDNDFLYGLYLKEYLQPYLFVYYIRDYLLSQQYFKKHGATAEPQLIKKADVVAANSGYLAEYAKKYNQNVADVGQGCDVEEFLPGHHPVPADIAELKKPVIGYCGSLTATRLDIKMIQGIAKSHPQWNIVLVGPEDEAFKKSALHHLPNVHFTGAKRETDLPAYVNNFDVCINPQLFNQMTIGNYPRKVDEYLAAGKPVVATHTKAMEMFGSLSYTGTSVEDYIKNIKSALATIGDEALVEERIAMARSHNWQASVQKIYNLIKKNMPDEK